MKNKFAWGAISLVAVLCAVAYVFFASGPQGPAMRAESELAVPATSETLADGQPVAAEQEQKSETVATLAPDEPPLKRESDTKGDRTRFTLNHGDIGYVDVRSIMQDRDPYSIVDLLQAHEELTGAGDSLEIKIERISENEIWGQQVFYRQVIDAQTTRHSGSVFFSSDGTVTRMTGGLINTQSLNAGDILILPPEAEAIALDAAARYAENLKPGRPEWSDLPVTFTAHPAETFYDLDSDSKLVRLWIVEVRIRGPRPDYVRVAMSPETGEVVRMDSLRVDQTYADQIFVVCDAGKAIGADGIPSAEGIEGEVETCDTDNNVGSPTTIFVNGICKLKPASLCQDPLYTTPLETVRSVLADVQAASPRSVTSSIQIIVNHTFKDKDKAGDWDEGYGAIRISKTASDPYEVAAHEAHHAVSRSPTYGEVEHPLVYGMTAIWTGRNSDWRYKKTSVAHTDRTYSGGAEITNVLYRSYTPAV